MTMEDPSERKEIGEQAGTNGETFDSQPVNAASLIPSGNANSLIPSGNANSLIPSGNALRASASHSSTRKSSPRASASHSSAQESSPRATASQSGRLQGAYLVPTEGGRQPVQGS